MFYPKLKNNFKMDCSALTIGFGDFFYCKKYFSDLKFFKSFRTERPAKNSGTQIY